MNKFLIKLKDEFKASSKKGKAFFFFVVALLIFEIASAFIPFEREVYALSNNIFPTRDIVVFESDSNTNPFYVTTVNTANTSNLFGWIITRIIYLNKDFESRKIEYNLPVNARELDLYSQNSTHEMRDNVILAAYKYLNWPVDYETKTEISVVISAMKYSHLFENGDTIIEINGLVPNSREEYFNIIKNRNEDLEFKLLRGQVEVQVKIPFNVDVPFVVREKTTFYNDDQFINDLLEYHFNVSGNSAGLLLTLDLIQQITSEDLVKDYTITGTGAIDRNGNVGSIGGIKYKVKQAHNFGADIFLVPAGENYQDALITKQELNTEMRVVPVETLQDAIEFLNNLEQLYSNNNQISKRVA